MVSITVLERSVLESIVEQIRINDTNKRKLKGCSYAGMLLHWTQDLDNCDHTLEIALMLSIPNEQVHVPE